MEVKILKPFYFKKTKQNLMPGDIANIPSEDGELWIKAGMAEMPEAKTIKPPIETAAMEPTEKAIAGPVRSKRTKQAAK